MTKDRPATIVPTWFGAFLFEGGSLLRAEPFPNDPGTLRDRRTVRREGRLVPEELAILASWKGGPVASRDRRFAPMGVRLEWSQEPAVDPRAHGFDPDSLRELLLEEAARDLESSWDPTVHVQEATRSLGTLDDVLNELGERLASWAEHDRPVEGEEAEGHRKLARDLIEGAEGPRHAVPGADPALAAARTEIARLYLAAERTHAQVEEALERAMPERAPNLCSLLGAQLAARLLSQAGSLERLARLPASTIQVLGAERAFFEHLRGRAPPPRHGLLFLHPRLHSAPRAQRGRLARALAGKVAIAARLDRAGRPVDPRLADAFAARAEVITRKLPGRRPPPAARRAGLSPST